MTKSRKCCASWRLTAACRNRLCSHGNVGCCCCFPSKLTNGPSHLIPPCQTAAHIPGRLKTGLRAPEWISHEYFIAVDYADTLRYPVKEIGPGTRAGHPAQCPCCSCICSFFLTTKATQLLLRPPTGGHSGSERMQKGAFGKRLRLLQHLS